MPVPRPRWLKHAATFFALSASLPKAAERLYDSLGITLPVGDFQPRVKAKAEEKPVKSTVKAEETRRKRRALARRILDDADAMMFLMILVLRGPMSLSWACTFLVPLTLQGNDTMTEEDLALRRDAARKHLQDTLIPALRDYWGLVSTSKVVDSTDKATIQNGDNPAREGQIVIEPTDMAFLLLRSITKEVRDHSVLLMSAFFTKNTEVGKAIEPYLKAVKEKESQEKGEESEKKTPRKKPKRSVGE